MPASYQAPMRKDKADGRMQSQTLASNLTDEKRLVSHLLEQKGQAVFSIAPGDTLGQAVEVLRDKGIGALLVMEGAALVGILSERDIVRKLADTPGQTLPKQVREVMTEKVQTCQGDQTLVSVLQTMKAGKFRHMPVTDGSQVVGMITIGDVVNFRLNALEYEALQLKQLIVG